MTISTAKCYGQEKKRTVTLKLEFNYFAASFFQDAWQTQFQERWEKCLRS